MMNITDIRIRRTYQDARLRAVVSVTIDNDLAIHDIKVIEGPQRLFVTMPSRRDEGGVYRDENAGGPPCQAGASRLFFALKQSPCFNVHQAAFGGV